MSVGTIPAVHLQPPVRTTTRHFVNGILELCAPGIKNPRKSDRIVVLFLGDQQQLSLGSLAGRVLHEELKARIRQLVIQHVKNDLQCPRHTVVRSELDIGLPISCIDERFRLTARNLSQLESDLAKAMERKADKEEIEGIEGKLYFGQMHLTRCKACNLRVEARDAASVYWSPTLAPIDAQVRRMLHAT